MQQHEHNNELIHESSPYLLQHAHNPVNWFPWSEAVLQQAKISNKPILVSIGYSACHWCHVMERESFEDRDVAAYMNDHFVNIKIDREERPDLDHIYMDAVQILTGSGGWPLNVFLTSEGKPFFGGTYFPPEKKYNKPSWKDILHFIIEIWNKNRNEAEEQANKLITHIQAASISLNKPGINKTEILQKLDDDFFSASTQKILKNADKEYGGFGTAPKFPQTFSIQFLLLYSYFYKDEESKAHALFSLQSMLNGGIYDHLAGGLARYSTDEKWLAPHFEKMLYDNALLIDVLCDAYQISGNDHFKKAIEQTIDFCKKEMHHYNGGFYAALDADSEGVEGKYYVWEIEEIQNILKEDAVVFCEYYNVVENGNWEDKNILHSKKSFHEFAVEKNIDSGFLEVSLEKSREKLLTIRNKRIRPSTDDKILLGWNALFLKALAKASAVLKNESYKQTALDLYEFIINNFSENGSVIYHSFKNGKKKYHAFLDDYACLIQACITMQELTGEEKYLLQAKSLTEFVISEFKQEGGNLFFYTSKSQNDVVIRKVEVNDSAVPSGNSIMAENLLYLAKIFDHQEWQNQAEQMLAATLILVEMHPSSFSVWLSVMLKHCKGYKEIIITGGGALTLLREVLSNFIPNKIIQSSIVEKKYPLLKNKKFGNEGLIYVCENFCCSEPIESIMEFQKLI